MPKISDILGGCMTAELNESAVIVQVAAILQCSIPEVRKKIANYGTGMIYTKGIIVRDTPKNRAKMTEMYGEIIILFDDGTVYCRTPKCKGQITRRQRKAERKRDIDLHKREVEAYRTERKTDRLFKACQGRPCPRHQGKANSHADIGKYVTSREPSERRDGFRVTAEITTIRMAGLA